MSNAASAAQICAEGATNTPETLTPDFEAIEAAGLHQMGQQWCAWKLIPRPGKKPGKVPYRNKKEQLGTDQPDEWLGYEEAKSLYLLGGFSGIGYLPMPEDGTVGLDVDEVIGSDGEVVESGRGIVAALMEIGCYLELSPSGSGLRGFVRGIKDGKSKVTLNGHSVEAYQPDKGWDSPDAAVSAEAQKPHYVTLTGRVWGEARSIDPPEAQSRLERFLIWSGLMQGSPASGAASSKGAANDSSFVGVCVKRTDDEVLKLLLADWNRRGEINKAWDGDTTAHGGASEARFAVLKQLWYITRDPEQIRRLVLLSGLDQTKFKERRNGYADRLDYEIIRAGLQQQRNYDADRAEKQASKDGAKARAAAIRKQADECGVSLDDLLNASGKLDKSVHVASELLVRDGRLAGVVYYDEFVGAVKKTRSLYEAFADSSASKCSGQWLDSDDVAVCVWLRRQWGIDVPIAIAAAAADRWARATSFNPVTERLQTLADEWDGITRVEGWLASYMGCDAESEDMRLYLSEVGKRFLVGVIARAFQPGAQQHQMLVLEGPQGAGKSAAVRALASAVIEDAYLEGFMLTENKDCLLQLRGKLLAEWSELVGFGKREAEHVKEFLTRGQDEYRDPFGRRMVKWPRTVSFMATTNENEYLRDASGNRRYWPVVVGRVRLAELQADAAQIIGEAVRLYQNGARWWIDPASPADARFRAICDREQRGRLVTSALSDLALDLADKLVCGRFMDEDEAPASDSQAFETSLMQRRMFPGVERVSSGEWMAAATALKLAGWGKRKGGYGRTVWFVTPEKVAELRQLHGLGPASGESSKRKNGAGLRGKK